MSPKVPPFKADPFEEAIAERLGLDKDRVAAGSIEVGDPTGPRTLIRWKEAHGDDLYPQQVLLDTTDVRAIHARVVRETTATAMRSLTETQRLRIRNALLAHPDLDLDAATTTAISYVLAPVVAEMLEETRRVAAPRMGRPGISGW